MRRWLLGRGCQLPFYWLTHTLTEHPALCEPDAAMILQARCMLCSSAMRLSTCAFVRALHDSDAVYQESRYSMDWQAVWGLVRADIEQFIGLVDAE